MKIPGQRQEDISIIMEVSREASRIRISQRFSRIQSQISQQPTPEQLYLKDKEQFFQRISTKITPFSEILTCTQTIQQKLTPIDFLDPTQLERIMLEEHIK